MRRLAQKASEDTKGNPRFQSSRKFFKFIPNNPAIKALDPIPRAVIET
jgi:hypothetical protein